MPFGVESSPDFPSLSEDTQQLFLSPMPFGVESSPDHARRSKPSAPCTQSPMPFGVESSPDWPVGMKDAAYRPGHQCLSASSPHRTWATITRVTGTMVVTNAFRRRVLTGHGEQGMGALQDHPSPMPFGVESSPDGGNMIAVFAIAPVSPMPFGVESSPDRGIVSLLSIGKTRHQCLSASSPHRTWRSGRGSYGRARVTNAFRRRVLTGQNLLAMTNPNLPASPMPFGVESSPDSELGENSQQRGGGHQCLSASSPHRTRGRYLRLRDIVRSPMPFGVESSPDEYAVPDEWVLEALSPMPFGVESSPDRSRK